MLPNLEDLLNNRLVLVLGAGASVDYGFPDWKKLAEMILTKLDELSSSSTDDLDRELALEWKSILENADLEKETIDQIISSSYGNLVRRHWIVNILKEAISNCERDDLTSRDTGVRWVEKLSKKYVDMLHEAESSGDDGAVLNLLRNFRVVSLNYDRVFANYFFPPIVDYFNFANLTDRDFLLNQASDLTEFFSTYQPHGSLGFISLHNIQRFGNPINSIHVIDGNKYTNFRPGGSGNSYGDKPIETTHIELVGESDMSRNYKYINGNFADGIQNCLVVGLSDLGLVGCKMNWSNFENIYYSGKIVPEDINGNFLALDMYADAIAANLCG